MKFAHSKLFFKYNNSKDILLPSLALAAAMLLARVGWNNRGYGRWRWQSPRRSQAEADS
jgi:hypothetical protein